MFVDPLAEQFTGWTPYHYVHQNPINLSDPTGMSVEGPGDLPSNWDYDAPVLDEIVIPARGEKIFNVKFYGTDYSIYENDDNIIASGFRMLEDFRKKSDIFLSGGNYLYDKDKGKAKGDQSLKNTSNIGDFDTFDFTGFMQASSFSKSADRTDFKYSNEVSNFVKKTKITNAALTGYNTGQNIPDSEVNIDNTSHVYEKFINNNATHGVRIKSTIEKDTTIKLIYLPKTKYKIYKREQIKISNERNKFY